MNIFLSIIRKYHFVVDGAFSLVRVARGLSPQKDDHFKANHISSLRVCWGGQGQGGGVTTLKAPIHGVVTQSPPFIRASDHLRVPSLLRERGQKNKWKKK